MTAPHPKPMQFRGFRRLRKGRSLYGFVNVTSPGIGQELDDLAVHQLGERRWVSLPGRPMIDPDGQALRDDKGRIRYSAPIRWMTHGISARFSERVIQLLLEHHPDAFNEDGPS